MLDFLREYDLEHVSGLMARLHLLCVQQSILCPMGSDFHKLIMTYSQLREKTEWAVSEFVAYRDLAEHYRQIVADAERIVA